MLTVENTNEMNALLTSHKMISCLMNPIIADATVLATIAQMAQDGKDEMALYVLHNIKPYALEWAEDGEEKGESKIDLTGLLSALLG